MTAADVPFLPQKQRERGEQVALFKGTLLVGSSTALPTGQPVGSWLAYSTSAVDTNALTIKYKTDANHNVIYRYDQNVWDYNLLANPLNPVNNVVNINNSPHTFLTRRNMQT